VTPRQKALAIGSPTIAGLLICLGWAVADRVLRPLGKPVA
jgi:hypothetical protein